MHQDNSFEIGLASLSTARTTHTRRLLRRNHVESEPMLVLRGSLLAFRALKVAQTEQSCAPQSNLTGVSVAQVRRVQQVPELSVIALVRYCRAPSNICCMCR